MPTCNNITFHYNCDWDAYLALPGISFSSLKDKPFFGNEGSNLGKRVHNYLLKPKEYDWVDPEAVIPIARKLLEFGTGITKIMVPECGITCNLEVDGFRLGWRGMPDLHLVGKLVVDFKIIAGSLKTYSKEFNYPEQLRGYMNPVSAPLGLIIAYNKKAKAVETELIKQDYNFWDNIVRQKGDLCACM